MLLGDDLVEHGRGAIDDAPVAEGPPEGDDTRPLHERMADLCHDSSPLIDKFGAGNAGAVEDDDALLDACSKRARPIIMTTVAMGAGMLPIAIGLGTDPSFRAPMAIVVIGGLITSTFLSLLVIPVVFTYVDDLVQRLQHLLPKHNA